MRPGIKDSLNPMPARWPVRRTEFRAGMPPRTPLSISCRQTPFVQRPGHAPSMQWTPIQTVQVQGWWPPASLLAFPSRIIGKPYSDITPCALSSPLQRSIHAIHPPCGFHCTFPHKSIFQASVPMIGCNEPAAIPYHRTSRKMTSCRFRVNLS